MPYLRLLFLLLFLTASGVAYAQLSPPEKPVDADGDFSEEKALAISQAALGRSLPDLTFTNRLNQKVALKEFLGKPLVISLVYTSCYHVCSMATRNLNDMVEKAKEALGETTFNVITVGFDHRFDKPTAMAAFARQQGVRQKNWQFLSGNAESIAALTRTLGFTWFKTVRGFDHITQASLIDQDGKVYRQVYGESYETPLFVDPIMDLVLGRPTPAEPLLAEVVRQVRLFCTYYDPLNDAYRFDWSLFIGMPIGASIILIALGWVIRERRRAGKAAPKPPSVKA